MDAMAKDTVQHEEDCQTMGLMDLFKKPQLTTTLLLLCLWPITTLGYYGLALSMSAFGE